MIRSIVGIKYKLIVVGGDDAEVFRNRKGYFSINTQMICESHLKIMNVVSRWPGSVHDATIFNNSRVKAVLEEDQRYTNCILLGKVMFKYCSR